MDQGSKGLAAPEAKVVVHTWKVRVHSQILRIRAEDSNIGEDIGEGNLSWGDKYLGVTHYMVFSRPLLPASPLSKNAY
ncbi:UNVERIFIED_CONTAM: hypothetical protein Scaly_0013100 [Sesamum calycinum]|uniref:Uncharacterized protein n=2 Tax=Sesamum TaxID=4181 RepID=A0AAE1XEC9_9LAMI|nr:hypothetical protein Sango_0060400 [Sesamum angolense]